MRSALPACLAMSLVAVLASAPATAWDADDRPAGIDTQEPNVRRTWEARRPTEFHFGQIERALAVPEWSSLQDATTAIDRWMPMGSKIEDPDGIHHKAGRVRSAAWAWDPEQGRTVLWIGTSSGGLYKRFRYNILFEGWKMVSGTLEGSPSVGAFVHHPDDSNRILLGTGDRGRGDDVGTGIYRTLDGGLTWTRANLFAQPGFVDRFIVDWQDASGNTVAASTSTGLWRTTDFGNSWTRASSGHPVHGVTDVAQNADTGEWLIGVPGIGVVSCQTLSGPCSNDVGIAEPVERVSIAVAPSNPDLVYALVAGRYLCSAEPHATCWIDADCGGAPSTCSWVDAGLLGGIYRSSNGGANFGRIEPAGIDLISGGQGFHAQAIAVDPDNSGRLFVGMAGLQWSANANSSGVCWWRNIGAGMPACCGSTCCCSGWEVDIGHSDQTSILFVPESVEPGGTRVLVTNDGGMYLYDWVTNALDDSLNEYGPNISQTYVNALATSEMDADLFLVGTQDNGIVRVERGAFPAFHYLPRPDGATGADGGPVSFSANNSDQMATSIGMPYVRALSTDGTAWTDLDLNLAPTWLPTVRFHRQPTWAYLYTHDDRYVYYRFPWESAATDWRAANGGHPLPANVSISALETGRMAGQLLYLTDYNSAVNGVALYAMESGVTGEIPTLSWEDRTPNLSAGANRPPGGLVSADRSAAHADYVYFVTGRFRVGGVARAYLSTNRGDAWWDVTGDLAQALGDVDFWQLVAHPADNHQLFLATEVGIFRSDNSGRNWYRYMDGLPKVVKVRAMEIREIAGGNPRLVIATWGHGLHEREVEFLDDVFSDGFDTGSTFFWSQTVGGI
jgi:photosystem II stability/assembly factor-like uncharacterized protein